MEGNALAKQIAIKNREGKTKIVQIKSKKKRIRQKVMKRALTEDKQSNNVHLFIQIEREKHEDIRKNVSVSGLPVTALLKLGKEYFKEEDIVKYYYHAKKDQFYKNKLLLETVLEEQALKLEEDKFWSYETAVTKLLSKRKI